MNDILEYFPMALGCGILGGVIGIVLEDFALGIMSGIGLTLIIYFLQSQIQKAYLEQKPTKKRKAVKSAANRKV